MAFVWLKAVPWSAIIANAPLVVEGAKKLVALVRSKPAPAMEPGPLAADASAGGPQSEFAALRARIRQLEEEQRESAELLRSMAENSASMVEALDYLRARVKTNGRIAAIALAGLVLLGGWLLLR
jgi:hypothetical protein